MTSRPRVLMVSARFHPDQGGIETHVAEVAPRLAELGLDIRVLTTDRTGLLPASDAHLGVPVRRVRSYPRSRDYYFAPALGDAIRNSGADLVHLQGYHTLVAPMAMLGASSARIPYVVSFHSGGHSSALRRRARRIQRVALRPLFRRAARLIAVSRHEQALFETQLGLSSQRFSLVRNGSSMPASSGRLDKDAHLVLSVGRLERYKGHHRLISAWPAVLAAIPTARLRILGVGPEESRLRQQVAQEGLQAAVEISSIDGADRQGMADALSEASLVALLSDYEAHPVAVMEALALGVPVLVSRSSGMAELVDDDLAAGLAPDASAPEISDAILRELGAPRAVDSSILTSWDDCAASLRDVYVGVLGAS